MEFLPYFLVSAASYFGLVAGSTIMKLAYSEKDELRQILFMIRKGLLFIIFVTAVFFTFGNTPVSLGFALFFAALSFFKRRIGIPSGKAFIPFDQVDFVIGALVFISFYAIVPIDIAIVILAISFVLDVAVNHFSFYLGLRKEKW